MSADNYMWIDLHPLGGYGVAMGFASSDVAPEVTTKHTRFEAYAEAERAAHSEWAEYGVRASANAIHFGKLEQSRVQHSKIAQLLDSVEADIEQIRRELGLL